MSIYFSISHNPVFLENKQFDAPNKAMARKLIQTDL